MSGQKNSMPVMYVRSDRRKQVWTFAVVLSLVLGFVAVPGYGEIPYHYPLFKQCNSSWGNDVMVTTTICKVGCLMSSTSMALAGNGILIDDSIPANPGSLNAWLRKNDGYDKSNDFEENVLPNITTSGKVIWPKDGMHRSNDLQLETVQLYLEQGRVMIANVMNGSHFVLVVGWVDEYPDFMLVNDPGFERTNYSYSQDIVGWRIFDMDGY